MNVSITLQDEYLVANRYTSLFFWETSLISSPFFLVADLLGGELYQLMGVHAWQLPVEFSSVAHHEE